MRNHHSRNCDPDPPTLRKLEKMSVSIAKDHHYSNLSPSSRTRRIEEGRREMIKMIRNLPESSYELSLKDIVDKQLPLQENQEEEEEEFEFPSAEEEEEFEFPSAEAESYKNQKRKKRKKVPRTTSHQHHQVSRCNSMETGSFLIKMFFPSFMASSKKPATSWNSRLKISPRTLFEGLNQRSLDTVSRINQVLLQEIRGVAVEIELKAVPAGATAIKAGTMTAILSWVAGFSFGQNRRQNAKAENMCFLISSAACT
ncbi:uncharacterized protein LOC104421989 isoform X2 [Eucalyptus grandis]|uniref:uncharacterized protein LOC104421989 isoform X2 n=1 Tax=Eucalyptus grandis TaxID=71139 RepID=UPI00192E9555|nr:uncharacterized protein LOC104421989 isoform X2 [Eucalyptus grandis]